MIQTSKNWFLNLSFRWKAIVFIASIEGAFNIMFAFIIVGVMQSNLEEQFFKRAQITSRLFATSTTNAVLSTDIASLESFVDEVMQNKDLLYARVKDSSGVLAERAKNPDFLKRTFVSDVNLSEVQDDVFDTFADIRVDDEPYGRVEIGVSTDLLGSTITAIQLKVIMIGVGEIIFSGLVSFLLGTFLVRRLVEMQRGSNRVAQGDFNFKLDESGRDELSETAKAFNNMSSKLNSLVEALKHTNMGLDEQLMVAENDLQRAQSQLIQASKMESLGTLAGGIAHEINTPAQFIGDNLRFLDDAFRDMNELIISYENLYATTQSSQLHSKELENIKDLADRIDVNDLKEEIGSAISESLDGIERVSRIILSMKDFSHPSTKEKGHVDIHDVIGTSITISRNEWKYVADIKTDLDDDLPLVSCFSGDLSQVLVNIIVNAAHAIKEMDQDKYGVITISTRHDHNWAEIRIKDTGPGIPENIKDRIFDPFFTTKGVGQGTGQGLAISFDIITNKHGGQIRAENNDGEGTTFILKLPLDDVINDGHLGTMHLEV